MITLRLAAPADAHLLWDAERRTAMTPGLWAARPGEIPVEAFKIEALVERGRYIVAELDDMPFGHAFLEPIGTLAGISHVSSPIQDTSGAASAPPSSTTLPWRGSRADAGWNGLTGAPAHLELAVFRCCWPMEAK